MNHNVILLHRPISVFFFTSYLYSCLSASLSVHQSICLSQGTSGVISMVTSFLEVSFSIWLWSKACCSTPNRSQIYTAIEDTHTHTQTNNNAQTHIHTPWPAISESMRVNRSHRTVIDLPADRKLPPTGQEVVLQEER